MDGGEGSDVNVERDGFYEERTVMSPSDKPMSPSIHPLPMVKPRRGEADERRAKWKIWIAFRNLTRKKKKEVATQMKSRPLQQLPPHRPRRSSATRHHQNEPHLLRFLFLLPMPSLLQPSRSSHPLRKRQKRRNHPCKQRRTVNLIPPPSLRMKKERRREMTAEEVLQVETFVADC